MSRSESFREYYTTGSYKGFYKLREQQYKLSGKVHLTFTNGKREVFAIGKFKEEALRNIFIKVDKLTVDNGSSSVKKEDGEDMKLL